MANNRPEPFPRDANGIIIFPLSWAKPRREREYLEPIEIVDDANQGRKPQGPFIAFLLGWTLQMLLWAMMAYVVVSMFWRPQW